MLFLLTIITTLMVGAELSTGRVWIGLGWLESHDMLSLHEWELGLPYSVSFLAFLTMHEFGHYFMALHHRVKTTLPYYIPLYIPLMLNIGSLGAVIQLKQIPDSTRKFFDIGVAGPFAGFVVSVFLLIYGFTHLPNPEEYILGIHPEYVTYFGGIPTEQMQHDFIEQGQYRAFETGLAPDESMQSLKVGTSLLFEFLKWAVPVDPCRVPDHFEMI
ncbi:MAG: site-2 protease family protein, partial [Bacteroidota bacterium]